MVDEKEQQQESEVEDDIAMQKQLAWAEHRIKELEELIASVVRISWHACHRHGLRISSMEHLSNLLNGHKDWRET